MPTYKVIHKKTKKVKEVFMPISELDEWERSNPKWEVMPGKPLIHSGNDLGLKSIRTDETFRDKLRELDKKNPGNTLRNYNVKF